RSTSCAPSATTRAGTAASAAERALRFVADFRRPVGFGQNRRGTTVEEYARGFGEEPGYLDYGRVGPLSATVRAEAIGQYEILSKARERTLARVRAGGEG